MIKTFFPPCTPTYHTLCAVLAYDLELNALRISFISSIFTTIPPGWNLVRLWQVLSVHTQSHRGEVTKDRLVVQLNRVLKQS